MCRLGRWFYSCGCFRFHYIAERCLYGPRYSNGCAFPTYLNTYDRYSSVKCENCAKKDKKRREKGSKDKRDDAERKGEKRDEERKRRTSAQR